MKNTLILFLSCLAIAIAACNDDDPKTNGLSVAFATPSVNLSADATPVTIAFSAPTPAAGTVTLLIDAQGATYGTDFTTLPDADGDTVTVPFEAGVTSVNFTFNKMVDAVEGQVKHVLFTITAVSVGTVAANDAVQVNFSETASLGAALAAEVGGATQPNQVYIDLSSGAMTVVPRVSWDLGFYSGTDFRVVLNSSLKMAAKKLETTNIDEVQLPDETMIIAQGQGIATQIDSPTGVFDNDPGTHDTAIDPVSANDADNKVYLINMGSNPATTMPAIGADASGSGASRGWMKIRVLRSGSDYRVQYAAIGATTHEEVTLSKNAAYNFTFFSLVAKNTVMVEPQKVLWDLNFTTFTNLLGGTTPYYFPDFVLTNLKGGARAYMVSVSDDVTYDRFTKADVSPDLFTENQTNIGSNWRSTSVNGPNGPVSQFVLKTDRFFIIKDPAGNLYKLKFTGGSNSAGERGYPTFQYTLLQ
ncbi:hypothetical protein HYN48_00405 [Flavobacterium magnum]|uniref:HmuY protein n=1 Tax=Flavobacterium magnum TaxID=2162713 RepID=A0A2S0RAK7_9FLAO|nr:HmuY family protein [Flavobacterium magnum]AWA28666.1 hypothetical protein HYN48_00405 [Flavobacterium magnum]